MTSGRPSSDVLEEGRALFNAGRFFEAHERWEGVWLVEAGPSKLLLQGLIQIAAGLLKQRQGLSGAAVRLLESGARRVGEAGTPPELADFVAEVRRRAGAIRESGAARGAERCESPVASWPLLPPFRSVK